MAAARGKYVHGASAQVVYCDLNSRLVRRKDGGQADIASAIRNRNNEPGRRTNLALSGESVPKKKPPVDRAGMRKLGPLTPRGGWGTDPIAETIPVYARVCIL